MEGSVNINFSLIPYRGQACQQKIKGKQEQTSCMNINILLLLLETAVDITQN